MNEADILRNTLSVREAKINQLESNVIDYRAIIAKKDSKIARQRRELNLAHFSNVVLAELLTPEQKEAALQRIKEWVTNGGKKYEEITK